MLKTVSTANGLVSPTFSGDVTLSTGNLVQGTAGKGVNFTANTPAAGMTSQLLNNYEEGTWTPSVTSGTGTITTMGGVSGSYTRIGRLITVTFDVIITDNGTGATSLQIAGLPFTSTSTNAGSGREINIIGGMTTAFINASSTVIDLRLYNATYSGGSGSRNIATLSYTV